MNLVSRKTEKGAKIPGRMTDQRVFMLNKKVMYLNGNGSYKITCEADPEKTYNAPEVFHYYNSDHTFKVSNAYSIGKMKGSSNVGGLFGALPSSSSNPTRTIKETVYNESCDLVSNEVETQTVRETATVTLANVFSAAEIEGSSALGGLAGSYSYSNSIGAKYSHIMNNAYATGVVPSNGGALFGNTSANITYKNMYYWPNSTGAQNVFPSGSAPAGVIAFEYVDAVPHITEYDVDLLDQLNGNIKSSSSPELGPKVSVDWEQKDHNLTAKLPVKIPFLMVGPSEELLKVGVIAEEGGETPGD